MSSSQQLLLGEGAGGAIPNYIEDVFQTWLYTGNGSTQTITNNIDLSTKGGLVWIKDINSGAKGHALFDTARGVNLKLQSQSTAAQFSGPNQLTAFNTTGFDLGSAGDPNGTGIGYVSWTFREQPKFFDVVTWTGDGTFPRVITHNLGSTPGCIIFKATNAIDNWYVYHRSLTAGNQLQLDSTGGQASSGGYNTTITSTNFSPAFNSIGTTYVAYLFAHDAGGFGLAGTDNVISCGSFTGTGQLVNLGYEPQWLLVKKASDTSDWLMFDNMRTATGGRAWRNFSGTADETPWLAANLSAIQTFDNNYGYPAATGFYEQNFAGTWIYIAIRRGPMKVPTLGTSVYNAIARTGTGADATVTGAGFTPDFLICADRTSNNGTRAIDRLRGPARRLDTNQADIERTPAITSFDMNGFTTPDGIANAAGVSYINWLYKRAPSFFDEVCYTGTGANRTVAHNLTVVPELMIVKNRVQAGGENWTVYTTATTATKAMYLNTTSQAVTASVFWNNTDPTATVFSVGTAGNVNTNTETYVAYLFATCAGVSKVGSYTGNGTTQTIDCGFTGGARFVLIKATSTTGNWMVFDTSRGMTVVTDPFLSLNSTAAETATLGACTTVSTGFALNESILTGVNTNGVSYIFLSVA